MQHFSSWHLAGGTILAMSANTTPMFSMLRLLVLLLLLLASVTASAQAPSSVGGMDAVPFPRAVSVRKGAGGTSGARRSPSAGQVKEVALLDPRSRMLQPGFKSRRRRTAPPRTRRSSNLCNQTCSSQKNITCQVTKKSNMCIHKDESATDFPNRPRNLNIEKVTDGNRVRFNITWKAPYDYSYQAVTGYELLVSRFARGVSLNPDVDCYFLNLSNNDWSAVQNVHDVVYFMDCAWAWANYRRVHVKVFSYPKLAGDHEEKATDAWIYPEGIKLKNPSLDWNPSILAVADVKNRSVMVTVRPGHRHIAFLKVCVTRVSAIPCRGQVHGMESPENAFRYRVEGLKGNQSYYIYVKPFNGGHQEMDIWIHSKEPFFLPPWPEETPDPTTTTTTTTESTTSQLPKPGVIEAVGVGVEVVAVLVVAVVLLSLALVSACLLHRKGYLQKIWFLRLCFPQTALGGPPLKVLQLYGEECSAFRLLVKTHGDLLRQFLTLDCLDGQALRHQPHMESWLNQAHTTLVYLSPRLAHLLAHPLPPDLALNNPLLARQVGHVLRLAAGGGAGKGGGQFPPPVVLVSPDCWASDPATFLRQLPAFRRLPLFHVSERVEPLVAALGGCRRSHGNLGHFRPGTAHAQELTTQIRTLVGTIAAGPAGQERCCAAPLCPNGACPNGLCPNGLAGGGDCDSTVCETNGSACLGSFPGQRLGHTHRTDSGFSSSAPEQGRGGSNSSWEQAGSPRGEGGEEERQPMIHDAMAMLSVSQTSVVFLPPESVGDEDSVVILNDFITLNAKGDW